MNSLSVCCALLSSVALTAQAQTCLPLGGVMKLTPDASCQISHEVTGVAFLGAPGTCFAVEVKGLIPGTGYAGMTVENMLSLVTGGLAPAPAILNESGLPATTDELNLPETRRLFTARSAISLSGGHVYTIDAGVLGFGAATEQLIVAGGDGKYQNASGIIYTFNNVIGQWSPYQGKLCLP